VDDKEVAALARPAAPVTELPRLPEDPLAALCPVELGLRQLDVLGLERRPAESVGGGGAVRQLGIADGSVGDRLAVGEDAALGRSDPRGRLEVALLLEGRQTVPAISCIRRDVQLGARDWEVSSGGCTGQIAPGRANRAEGAWGK
jgi:hypothetical protein